jgi:hypothetical protein
MPVRAIGREREAMTVTRRSALATAAGVMAAAAQADAQDSLPTAASHEGQQFFLRLLKANDDAVARILSQPDRKPSPNARLGRGGNVAAMVAAYCSPDSTHYRARQLIPRMEQAAETFRDALNPEGLLDAGNLSSPPDTGFVVDALSASLRVIRTRGDEQMEKTGDALRQFLLRVGDALVKGGVHTPNHRWVVCCALARIHSLFPDTRYVGRIDDWLGEGIYQDADGLFAERSPNYARVEVNAFLTMARLLHRPQLLEPVRNYLTANLYLMQPDGELEVVNSRRQDQTRPVQVANFCLEYRYMAILDRNPAFAAVARLIAASAGENLVEGSNPVIYFLEEPSLLQPLPEGGEVPSDFSKVFANSHLVRIRRGDRAASIYGGIDMPQGIASGLAHNPTFFNFRKGRAILDSVRMGGRFFSLGVFRAQGIHAEENRFILYERFEAPYYQPLPKEQRNVEGDYALTPAKDGRFWSKMDFPNRPMSNVQVLDQKVTVVEVPRGLEPSGGFDLHLEITGHDRVPYSIEFAFRPGGTFEGDFVEPGPGGGSGDVQFLRTGLGRYRVGQDVIEFGPGQADHELTNLSGHTYQAHGAVLRAAGHCVYITGYTPFRKVITIRGL